MSFIPLKIDTIRPNCPFKFDVYIKINQKYILYIRQGDDIEESRLEKFQQIEKLREKNVERLFIPKDQEAIYEKFIDDEIDVAIDPENDLKVDERVDIITEIAENAIEVIYTEPNSREAYRMTEKAATGLRKLVSSNPKVLDKFYVKKGNETIAQQITTHSRNVAALALRVAFSLGYRGQDLDNLGAAALIHDVGLTNMKKDDQEFLFKRPDTRKSPDDKRIYQKHVQDALEILEDKEHINPVVLSLIAHHEEKNMGNGYPEKIQKLEPLEEILSLANCYDKRVTIYGLDPFKAFKEFQMEEMGNYQLPLIKKLKEVLESEEVFKLD